MVNKVKEKLQDVENGVLWKSLAMSKVNNEDFYQTPIDAIELILPHIEKFHTIWEISCGNGNIVKTCKKAGHSVYGTDILQGINQNFLTYRPRFKWDLIFTNPPFSLKYEFLAKCYTYEKPFILLLPLPCLGYLNIAKLVKKHGSMTIMVPPRKIKYIDKEGKQENPHFASAFFAWKVFPEKDNKIMFL